jgi:hypothetical protein
MSNMLRKKFRISSIILFSLLSATCSSQTDSVFTFLLPNLKITQTEKSKAVAYSFTKDYHLFKFAQDTLSADTSQYVYKVSLSDIISIRLKDNTFSKASVSSGILFGLIAGGTAGLIEAAVGKGSRKGWDIVLVTVGVGTVAAFFAAIITGDQGQEDFMTYNFPQKKTDEKRRAILDVLRKYDMGKK